MCVRGWIDVPRSTALDCERRSHGTPHTARGARLLRQRHKARLQRARTRRVAHACAVAGPQRSGCNRAFPRDREECSLVMRLKRVVARKSLNRLANGLFGACAAAHGFHHQERAADSHDELARPGGRRSTYGRIDIQAVANDG